MSFNLVSEDILDLEKLILKEVDFYDMWAMHRVKHQIAKDAVLHENVQKFLLDTTNKFDVVIGEWLYTDLYSG